MSKPPENLDPEESGNVAVEEAPAIKPARKAYQARPAAPRVPQPQPAEDEEDDGFFVRNKVLLIVGALVVVAGVWFGFFRKPSEPSRPAPVSKPVIIQIAPPPPPPPPVRPTPPPKVEPPKDLKPVDKAPEEKPMEPKPVEKPAEKPPEGLGTNVKGNGPGLAGLGSSGNGMIGGTGSGAGGGGSMAKWYAQQFQSRLVAALREHPKTRRAVGRVDVNVWWDEAGKVSKAQLVSGSGNSEVDAAVTGEILTRLSGPEAPPKGLKMPVTYRLNLKRP